MSWSALTNIYNGIGLLSFATIMTACTQPSPDTMCDETPAVPGIALMEEAIQRQHRQFQEALTAQCSVGSLLKMGHWFTLYIEPATATQWYEAATIAAPDDFRGWFYLGIGLRESANSEGAITTLEKAAELNNTIEVQRELARTHYIAGAYSAALDVAQPLIELYDDDGARLISADVLIIQRETDRARDLLEAVRNRNPRSSAVEYRLTRLISKGNPAQSTRNSHQTGTALDSPLLRARQRLDVSSRIMHLRGVSAAVEGDCGKAQYWFQAAIDAAPGVREHEENLEKLLATQCRQQL